MFKHYFEQMEGIGRYPVFSLLVFLSFFIWVFLYAFYASKPYIHHMSHLPLDEQATTGQATNQAPKQTK